MGYIDEIEFINSLMNMQAFLSYYNARNDEDEATPLDVSTLKALIGKHLTEKPQFSLPRLVKINKMSTGKPREVFVFEEGEQLVLKYINYLISTLSLGIHPACFSFQRGIRITHAVQHIKRFKVDGLVCIKLDISNYFNSINTDNLKEWIPESLLEKSFLMDIVTLVLKREEILVGDSVICMKNKGVMAGMPLAPTLSNLYLKAFDRYMTETYGAYARYSDDMVVFCSQENAQEALCDIGSQLAKLGLSLNAKKTKITLPGEPYEFLGLSIRGDSIDLSSGTIEKIKGKIKRQARSIYRWKQRKNVPLEKAIMVMNRKFNRKFFGFGAEETDFTWSKYFFGVLTETQGLALIDHYYQETIRFMATGKYTRTNYKIVPYKMLKEQGYVPLVSMYYRGRQYDEQ